jgi:hypothetical protein
MEIRNWLDTVDDRALAGGHHIWRSHQRFTEALPMAAREHRLNFRQMTYADICRAMEEWPSENF